MNKDYVTLTTTVTLHRDQSADAQEIIKETLETADFYCVFETVEGHAVPEDLAVYLRNYSQGEEVMPSYDLPIYESPADKADKKRVIVRKERKHYALLVGQANMNTQVYEGKLRHCLNLKVAFLATGEYLDESEEEFRE